MQTERTGTLPTLSRMTSTAERTSAPPTPRAGTRTRLTALDGLRGIAAIDVVLYHLFLVAEPVLRREGGSGVGSVLWWVSQTPLKLLTAGSEAVLVFFVLSGLVVALPALKTGGFSWAGFLSGRLARLYLPVWASMAVGTLLIWMIPRSDSAVTPGTWMDNSQATSISWGTLLNEASLTRTSYDVNNVLWSLRWELAFSVLLPLFVALAIVVSRYWAVALGVAVAVSTVGVLAGIDAFQYLPVFFIGALMAVRLDAIREWTRRRRLRPRSTLWGVAVVAGSLLLLLAQWLLRPVVPSGSIASTLLAQLSVLGAAGLVFSAIGVPFVRSALEARVSQWLGTVSFSLYLVHMPILATLTFVFGDDRWWLVALLTVPLALLAAWGFNRAVERPSHRLARRISGAVSSRLDAHRGRMAKATATGGG
jgi:peptidoglycan/LPS O-acetylase OafA/YrhL